MSDASSIEWTDATWNPVRGCTKVSPGCKHCYAETFAERFRGVEGHPYEQGFDPRLVPGSLDIPLRWGRPRFVFVNSMSDLFGEFVPDEYRDQVFARMLACEAFTPKRLHTFQVLTKRAEELAAYFAPGASRLLERWSKAADGQIIVGDGDTWFSEFIGWATAHAWRDDGTAPREEPSAPFAFTDSLFPLPRLWLGVSVEDRKYGLPRIEQLRRVPAAVRFLSIEPLQEDLGTIDLTGIGWVIVGGESGQGDVRPMHPDWVRSIRDQCLAAHVPFFFKQWGAWHPEIDRDRDDPDGRRDYRIDGKGRRILNLAGGQGFHGDRVHLVVRVGKGKAGRLLDGRTWDEMPKTAKKSRSAA